VTLGSTVAFVARLFQGCLLNACILPTHGKQERDGDAGEGRHLSPSPAPVIS